MRPNYCSADTETYLFSPRLHPAEKSLLRFSFKILLYGTFVAKVHCSPSGFSRIIPSSAPVWVISSCNRKGQRYPWKNHPVSYQQSSLGIHNCRAMEGSPRSVLPTGPQQVKILPAVPSVAACAVLAPPRLGRGVAAKQGPPFV